MPRYIDTLSVRIRGGERGRESTRVNARQREYARRERERERARARTRKCACVSDNKHSQQDQIEEGQ